MEYMPMSLQKLWWCILQAHDQIKTKIDSKRGNIHEEERGKILWMNTKNNMWESARCFWWASLLLLSPSPSSRVCVFLRFVHTKKKQEKREREKGRDAFTLVQAWRRNTRWWEGIKCGYGPLFLLSHPLEWKHARFNGAKCAQREFRVQCTERADGPTDSWVFRECRSRKIGRRSAAARKSGCKTLRENPSKMDGFHGHPIETD